MDTSKSAIHVFWSKVARRSIPHKLERAGYRLVRNPNAKDGYWAIDAQRQAVRAKSGKWVKLTVQYPQWVDMRSRITA